MFCRESSGNRRNDSNTVQYAIPPGFDGPIHRLAPRDAYNTGPDKRAQEALDRASKHATMAFFAAEHEQKRTLAQVAELVDALGSGPSGGNTVEVRVLSWAPDV